ncbi:glucose oxidase [Penicillium taxi]|uniref:glucose oxidase n=1 Tax=Penicillium taxi TaxID=168475 RepID=UPI0025454A82|nr:glucose oxidase [Penicillium taxi]KAJ5907334.1 glucose oxidase [Penicillium taxi]
MKIWIQFISFAFLTLLTDATILYDPEKISGRVFDYIIVGGGLTGLTAAARLTTNQYISVLVIESGFFQSTRGPIVETVTPFGQAFGTSLDHAFQTVPLKINGRSLTIHAGKCLGGSSLINGASYTSPAKIQIDFWESHLGNKGWNWKTLYPYIKKKERAHPPTKEQIAAGFSFDLKCHGEYGKINVSPRDSGERYSPIIRSLMTAVERRGVPTQKDLNCGDPHGVSMLLNTIHPNQTRADAARELLLPIASRPNLWIIVGQNVGKVLIDRLSAKGVEFGTEAHTFHVYSHHEVILAAGALVTPLILEYSGIGLKSVLDAAGVSQIVDLPVGQNLQDQSTTGVQASINTDGSGQGQAIYFATWSELFSASDLATARGLLDSQFDQWVADAVQEGGFDNSTALKIQMGLNRELILHHNVSYVELFLDISPEGVGFSVWVLLPFTRGYVHILHKDPYLGKVTRNPRYLENDLDRYAQAAASLLARDLFSDPAMRPYVRQEEFPGATVPYNATVDDWVPFVTQNFQPNYHAIGTCSMMGREMGGVVDPSGRVYGVQGLRVIDASIIPQQLSSHLSAVLYGMSERLADLILEDYEKKLEK